MDQRQVSVSHPGVFDGVGQIPHGVDACSLLQVKLTGAFLDVSDPVAEIVFPALRNHPAIQPATTLMEEASFGPRFASTFELGRVDPRVPFERELGPSLLPVPDSESPIRIRDDDPRPVGMEEGRGVHLRESGLVCLKGFPLIQEWESSCSGDLLTPEVASECREGAQKGQETSSIHGGILGGRFLRHTCHYCEMDATVPASPASASSRAPPRADRRDPAPGPCRGGRR